MNRTDFFNEKKRNKSGLSFFFAFSQNNSNSRKLCCVGRNSIESVHRRWGAEEKTPPGHHNSIPTRIHRYCSNATSFALILTAWPRLYPVVCAAHSSRQRNNPPKLCTSRYVPYLFVTHKKRSWCPVNHTRENMEIIVKSSGSSYVGSVIYFFFVRSLSVLPNWTATTSGHL